MDENKGKAKISFRVEWNFEADTPEAIAIEYINSLGIKKRSEVIELLMQYFYPKAVYDRDLGNGTDARSIRDMIIQLEQRAVYLRRLLDLNDAGLDERLALQPPPRRRSAPFGGCVPELRVRSRIDDVKSAARQPEEAMGGGRNGQMMDDSSNLGLESTFVDEPIATGTSLDLKTVTENWDKDWDEEDCDNLPNPYDDGI